MAEVFTIKSAPRLIAKHLLIRSVHVGKKFLFTAAALLAATILSGPFKALGQSDDATKKAFLQSRNNAVPAVSTKTNKTSTPPTQKKEKAKPKPATRKKQTAPERTPSPTPRTTPHPVSTPRPVAIPATPTPSVTPRVATLAPEATPRPVSTPPPAASPSPTPATPTPRPTISRGTPAPTPAPRGKKEIVVEKSGGLVDELLPPPPPERRGWFFSKPKYKYLTPEIRNAIDKAAVAKSRWRYIVIHNSGTRQGNAKAFEYYHLNVRKMPNGLAYHFVIGNGASSRNGGIEIGNRWRRQINGGHVHSDYLNNIAIGICLVGDYNRDQPTTQQLEALDELIRYLRRRVGKTERKPATIKAHKDINPVPTDCPGNKFPYRWLYTRFE